MAVKPSDEAIIAALRSSAGVMTIAAQKLKVSRQTLHAWVGLSPALAVAVNEIREETLDLAEANVLTALRNGDRESTKFYLRCFGKTRGWVETWRVEGKDGGAVQLAVNVPDYSMLSLDERRQLLSLQRKAQALVDASAQT